MHFTSESEFNCFFIAWIVSTSCYAYNENVYPFVMLLYVICMHDVLNHLMMFNS